MSLAFIADTGCTVQAGRTTINMSGILESDGNPVDGNEEYSWTEDAAKLFYVMGK